ncbi:MAG: glycosyltransferase, partial [Deferribacteraceae bacterium]|nr:glycosyltransferase [Deferribacteraceae bacterium]
MNIAFDATGIEVWKGSGIGNYTLNQFKAMASASPQDEFYYFNIIADSPLIDAITAANFHKIFIYTGIDEFIQKGGEQYYQLLGSIIKNFITEYSIDIFYITAPFTYSAALYKREWFKDAAVIASVYDIIPYVMREVYLNQEEMFNWYISCINMLRTVDRLLAISMSVKEDMVKHLSFNPDNIDVIYGGVG